MSRIVIENIMARAINDESFRQALLKNPDGTLDEYKDKLTEEEMDAIKNFDEVKLREWWIPERTFRYAFRRSAT